MRDRQAEGRGGPEDPRFGTEPGRMDERVGASSLLPLPLEDPGLGHRYARSCFLFFFCRLCLCVQMCADIENRNSDE